MRTWTAVLLVVVSAAACRRSERRPKEDFTPLPTLSEGVRLTERTHKGDEVPIDRRRQLARVDFRSRIAVEFDRKKILAAARSLGTREGMLPPEPASAQENRERSRELIAVLKEYAATVDATEKDLATFRKSGVQDPAEREKKLRELRARVAVEGGQRLRLLQAANRSIEAEARRRGLSVETDPATGEFKSAEYKAMRDRVAEELLPRGQGLSVEAMTRLLNGEYFVLVERMDATSRAAERAGAIRFRVRALLYKEGEKSPLPLHLPGYDTIEAGVGPAKRAVTFNLSEKEMERLRQDLELAAEFADLYNTVREKRPELKERLKRLREALEGDLKAFGERFKALFEAGALESALEELALRAKDEATRAALGKEAAEAAETLRALVATLRGLREAAEAGRPDELVARVLGEGLPALAGLPAALDALPKVVDAVKAAVAKADLKVWAEPLAAKLAPWTKEEVERLKKELKEIEGLMVVGRLFVATFQEHQAPDRAAAGVDPRVTARGLDEIVNTEISIGGSPADRNDRVVLFVELLRAEGTTDVVAAAHEQELAVERIGLNSRVGAHVIFAKRHDEPGGGVPETNFEAAPAASWTLHVRARGDSFLPTFWNTVDPAVGLNVAALQFENDGVELGVGAHMTFFGDLVQAGYAWNLNVDEDRGYFFVGIGLTDLLNVASVGVRKSLDEEK